MKSTPFIALGAATLAVAAWVTPSAVADEVVQIPAPQGPLEAAQIALGGATHVVVIVPGSGPIDRDGNSPQMGRSSGTRMRPT